MKNRYFDFLCSIVGRMYEYSKLLGELHGMEFYSLIPNDDNRCEDGKQLREKFNDEEGQQALSQSDLGECTVLEMLIGLSFRLEFETMSSRWEKTPSEWFWILIDNLGLMSWEWTEDNGGIDVRIPRRDMERERTDYIQNKVGIFLDRSYDTNGHGGLFPLRNPQKDQRRIEIWYQMSAYILENYPI